MQHGTRAAFLLAMAVAASGMAVPAEDPESRLVTFLPSLANVVKQTQVLSFPVFDAGGGFLRNAAWRAVNDTGNCCENYIATTPAGGIYDFGGTRLVFSNDRGLSWTRLSPPGLLLGGEGAVAVAPGGDVLGVGWDAYGGDRLHVYKYTAATGRWSGAEQPLHSPFYDRPWLAVFDGPFTLGGQDVPYIVVLKGGYPSKDTLHISTDGISYNRLGTRYLDAWRSPRIGAWLDVGPDVDADWSQALARSGLTSLGPVQGQGSLGLAVASDIVDIVVPSNCAWQATKGVTWPCFGLPQPNLLGTGPLLRDGAGRLHQLARAADAKTFTYSISADGGRSWTRTTTALPAGFTIEDWDFKTSAALGFAAVGIHAHNGPTNTDQDFVYKFRTSTGAAVLLERFVLGKGDLNFGSSAASTGERFDFVSVGILPDGKLVATFGDTDHLDPTLAVEL